MLTGDIRPVKARLREHYKALRRAMTPADKAARDRRIARRVGALWQYRQSRMLLTYVSTAIEVDTRGIIRRALDDGKIVGVPRCVDGTRNMEFYRIRSLEELEPRTFGVLEPDPARCEKLTNFQNSLCLVPALCYDEGGYRLGYGKGYYDRFLSRYPGVMVGIAYRSCVRRRLPRGRFDRPVELLVTEQYVRRTAPRSRPATEESEGCGR